MLGYVAGDINNAVGATQGHITDGVGGWIDPTNAGVLKAHVAARSQAMNPRSVDGRTAYVTALTGNETPVFNQVVLANDALATHATAVLLQFLRECKGGTLDDAGTGGGDWTDGATNQGFINAHNFTAAQQAVLLDFANAEPGTKKNLAYQAINAQFNNLMQHAKEKYGKAAYRFAGNLMDQN